MTAITFFPPKWRWFTREHYLALYNHTRIFFKPFCRFRAGWALDKRTAKESDFWKWASRRCGTCCSHSVAPSSPYRPSTDPRYPAWWSYWVDGQTMLKEHYNHYALLKDVLHHPRRKDVGQGLKLRHSPFLNNALGRIIHLETYGKEGLRLTEKRAGTFSSWWNCKRS